MMNAEIISLRKEYAALVRVAEGLVEMIRHQQACNTLTIARMADQARAAARHIASEIERLIFELRPAPTKKEKRTVRDTLACFFSRVVDALAGALDALAA